MPTSYPTIGTLRERIGVQTKTSTADAIGGRSVTYSTTLYVWAKVEPLTGGERLRAQQVLPTLTYRVTVRQSTAITATSRLSWDGRTLQIVAPPQNVNARDRFLVLDCAEVTT
jgi:SPP1 family predicted phage head-tail adaptor